MLVAVKTVVSACICTINTGRQVWFQLFLSHREAAVGDHMPSSSWKPVPQHGFLTKQKHWTKPFSHQFKMHIWPIIYIYILYLHKDWSELKFSALSEHTCVCHVIYTRTSPEDRKTYRNLWHTQGGCTLPRLLHSACTVCFPQQLPGSPDLSWGNGSLGTAPARAPTWALLLLLQHWDCFPWAHDNRVEA